MYVGVGASRVRDLFEQAKKVAPAIIFIDEIDAVGRQRGTGLGGGHDEREQTLNQLLVEMDGFGTNQGVVVMAATNRADILDPALLRPGRFDRQVYVGLPDITRPRGDPEGPCQAISPLPRMWTCSTVAKGTPGFTGADLENLSNEAALLAARRGSKLITMSDFSEAEIKVIAGPEKKSRVVSEHERKLTAYHEAGHAIVMHALPTHDPVHQITIVPRGGAGGMTISLPTGGPLVPVQALYGRADRLAAWRARGGKADARRHFDRRVERYPARLADRAQDGLGVRHERQAWLDLVRIRPR